MEHLLLKLGVRVTFFDTVPLSTSPSPSFQYSC